MKIAKIETLRLKEFPQLLWVEVTADDGLVGLGETFFAPGAVETFIHDYAAPYLLGQDPRDVDRHAHKLMSVYVGSQDSGAEMRAASAIDLALWDILAKSLSAPVWRLMGGKVRNSIPVYNTCAGYKHARATKRPGRDAAHAHRLVYVFLEVAVQHMFEQSGKAVVVLGHDKNEPIRAADGRRKRRVFDRFTRVIDREPDVSDVDQFCFHVRAPRDLFDDKPRDRFTQTALPRGAEDDGQKDRASE